MFWYLVKSRILLKFFGLESYGTLWPTSRAHNFGLKWGTEHRFCTWAPSNAPINILKDKNLADCPFKEESNEYSNSLTSYCFRGFITFKTFTSYLFGISFSFYFCLEHRVSIEGNLLLRNLTQSIVTEKCSVTSLVTLAHAWNF